MIRLLTSGLAAATVAGFALVAAPASPAFADVEVNNQLSGTVTDLNSTIEWKTENVFPPTPEFAGQYVGMVTAGNTVTFSGTITYSGGTDPHSIYQWATAGAQATTGEVKYAANVTGPHTLTFKTQWVAPQWNKLANHWTVLYATAKECPILTPTAISCSGHQNLVIVSLKIGIWPSNGPTPAPTPDPATDPNAAPGVPQELAVTRLSSKKARVSWSPPGAGGTPSSYLVSVRAKPRRGSWSKWRTWTVQSHTLAVKVRFPRRGWKVAAYVRARNSSGTSPATSVVKRRL